MENRPPLSVLASFVFGVALLAFLTGIYVAEYKYSPYYLVRNGFQAASTLSEVFGDVDRPVHTNLWHRRDRNSTGVVRNTPNQVQPGYTFYTSSAFQGANLVDSNGNVVQKWRAPFREVWDDTSHVYRVAGPDHLYWRDAHLYPDGDVLALYIGYGATPWGHGLARLDVDGNVKWTFDQKTHHDVEVGPDGDIYTLTHDFRNTRAEPVEGFGNLDITILDDFVVQLSPDGELKRKFSVVDALADSHLHGWVRNTLHNGNWDLLHTNAVEPVSEAFAEHHDAISAGDLLLSFRRTDMIVVYDVSERSLAWAGRGDWVAQHDPDALPNGNLLLFDNRGPNYDRKSLRSRVVEFAFGTRHRRVEWEFSGSDGAPLQSWIRSMQQKLPNDNILITESNGGRLLEVTPEGRVAWEFHAPSTRDVDGETYVPAVSAGRRIPSSELEFDPERN